MKKALILACGLALGTLSGAYAQEAMLHQTAKPEMYVRLPSQWKLLLADGARDEAALRPYWKQVQEKLARLPGTLPELSAADKLLLDDLLTRVNGGLELAFYLGKNGAVTVAGVSHYAFRDEAEFFAWWQAAAEANGWMLAGNGKEGRITFDNGETLAYRFDAGSGRVQALFAPQLPETPDWSPFAGEGDPSLQAAAAAIDPNGDGLLLWLRNNPLVLAGLSSERGGAWVQALQLLKLKSLALGYGTADDGHPRLQFNAEISPGGLRDFLPMAAPATDLAVHGELQALYAFTLPDAAQMRKILRIIEKGSGNPENLYQSLQSALASEFRIDTDLLFDALGTQWTVINDDFGTVFAAPRHERFDAAIAMLEQAGVATLEDAGDSGIRHLRLNIVPLLEKDPEFIAGMEKAPIIVALLSTPYHVYWQDEGDYRVFATLPQPLMDRKRSKSGKHAGSYLAQGGISEPENSAFVMARIDHLARKHYYTRLHWLQYLADVAGVSIPMDRLPSPQMLNFPASGHIGAAISGDAENLRAEIRFENSHLDILHSSGYNAFTGMASLGILSAIVLPAYQDYVKRANAMSGDTLIAPDLTEAEKAAISQTIDDVYDASAPLREKIGRGEKVEDADIASLQNAIPGIVEHAEDHGLYFTFNGEAPAYLQESTLILWPEKDEKGETLWFCYLEDPYLQGDVLLPPSCSPYNL
ncbi:MAG: hypothetical protein Q4A06_08385 [Cardiobacteriaceae bacterium]|nr:hypothetical protein [Cardiobacteriaceae bacterium]